MAIKGTPSRP